MQHPDIGWCREYAAAMQPHATGGVYVNFLSADEGESRIRAAYGERFEPLSQVKARYDPHNVFRANQNIPPARQPAALDLSSTVRLANPGLDAPAP
jgi:hypothetical protein